MDGKWAIAGNGKHQNTLTELLSRVRCLILKNKSSFLINEYKDHVIFQTSYRCRNIFPCNVKYMIVIAEKSLI